MINKNFIFSTPFLEFSQLAGFELYQKEEVQSGSMVTGIGTVHG